jgi:predicted PurR-regulated permease PerM
MASGRRVMGELIPRRLAVAVLWAAGLMILGLAVWLVVRAVSEVLVVWVPCAVALLLTALLSPFNLWLRRLGLARGLAPAETSIRLHPLAIILVIALGATLGGIVGILVAVPITGVAYNAWGPLNGRTAQVVVEARRPSRISRLWSALWRAMSSEKRRP